jgi:pimeloyl-ACP methyl ester carboxylesterase
VREYPLFLPYGEDHLAAVLSVPDTEPAGLVVLTTGGAAGRSHRHQLWTRTARRLATESGLASLRLDYRGTGDATGTVQEWRMSEPPTEQVHAAVAFATDALGVRHFATMGNCMGSLVALSLAADMPGCVGAFCIRHPVLEAGHVTRTLVRARRTGLAAFVRSRPGLSRLAKPLVRKRRKASGGVRPTLGRALRNGRVLMLFSQEDVDGNKRLGVELGRLRDQIPPQLKARFELRILPGGGLVGFESLDAQAAIMDAAVELMGSLFGGPSAVEGAAWERARSR